MKKIINNKILIDPGHVGESFFDFRSFTIDNIEFHEGDFCYAWGEIINNYLIELGSECSLSRKKGQPSILINIEDQQKRKHELISTIGEEATLKRFRVPRNFFLKRSVDELLDAAIQNEADLVSRAKSANIERFDFCLSLHLNGDPNNLITQRNGICGFTNKISKTHFLLFKNIISNLSKETGLGII